MHIENKFTATKSGKPHLVGEGWFLILDKSHAVVRDKKQYSGVVCINTDQVRSEMKKFLPQEELTQLLKLISQYMEGSKIWDGQKFQVKTVQES